MLKLKIRKTLYAERNGSKSMLSSSIESGITYPTYHAMAEGDWNPNYFQNLARFLESLGFTAQELAQTKFGEVFNIEQVKAERVTRERQHG